MLTGVLCALGIIGFLRIAKFEEKNFPEIPKEILSSVCRNYLIAFAGLALGAGIPLLMFLVVRSYINRFGFDYTALELAKSAQYGGNWCYFLGIGGFIIFYLNGRRLDQKGLIVGRLLGKKPKNET